MLLPFKPETKETIVNLSKEIYNEGVSDRAKALDFLLAFFFENAGEEYSREYMKNIADTVAKMRTNYIAFQDAIIKDCRLHIIDMQNKENS